MLISAIVPVYNAEKFIVRCVNSVLSQTYDNWELILIDDGSTDNSLLLLQDYAAKDKRIKVIHQNNKGAGSARNAGISEAKGNYIVFIDSDDYIEPTYFEILSKHDEDVVFIDVNRRDEHGNITCIEKMSVNRRKSKNDILREQMTGKILWGGVRKAVKKDIIAKYNVRYSDLRVGEEAIYSFKVLYHAKTFSFIDVPVYNYVVHEGSLSQTLIDDPWGPISISMKDCITQMGVYKEYADTINAFIITAGAISLYKMAKIYSYNEYLQHAKIRVKRLKTEIDTSFNIDYKHMDIKAKLITPLLKIYFLMPIYYISKLRK